MCPLCELDTGKASPVSLSSYVTRPLIIELKQMPSDVLHGMGMENKIVIFQMFDAHRLQASTNPQYSIVEL